MSSLDIKFEKINKSKEHIHTLYNLLQSRTHNISHKHAPSVEEHSHFVKNHPYRYWYLVKQGDHYKGSIYIKDDNSLGINLALETELIKKSILFFLKNFKPLPSVKSVRSKKFHINIAPENIQLRDTLIELGAELIEHTYTLENY